MTDVLKHKNLPQVLYEDDDILVINKPPGLLSIPDGYNSDLPHLRSVLEPHFGKLWMVHRLDKETSGTILLAKNAAAHRIMNASFRSNQVKKTYHGLVTPAPDWQDIAIDFLLLVNADRKHRTRVNPENGKEAHSDCKVLKRFALGALLEIQIQTGITHQIRAHLRACNLMLLGDVLYGSGLPSSPITVSRTMLHARAIAFQHPIIGTWMTFSASYFDDFRDAYTKLRVTTTPDVMLL